MTASLHCSPAIHAALASDPAAFARGLFAGYQIVEDGRGPVDVVELRDCPHCGRTIPRVLGIETRLAAARSAHRGDGDQHMIGICKRALRPDPMTGKIDESAIRTFLAAVVFDAMMPRAADAQPAVRS